MSALRRAAICCLRQTWTSSCPWAVAASNQLHDLSGKSPWGNSQKIWRQNGWNGRWRSTIAAPTDDSISSLMDGLSAAKLKDQLDVYAQNSPFMTYQQLLEFIRAQGAADTDNEAHERADALQRAGVILRFNGVVYLRPQEVSELVFRALPTDPTTAKVQAAEVEKELDAMDNQFKAIQASARRWPRFWTTFGCFVLFGQLVGFSYLTWWELSWDVMEPIAYIVGLSYSFVAYVYFLATRGNYLDYGPFQEYWSEKMLEKRMAQHGFDMERYQHLMRTKERYSRYLQAQADAPHIRVSSQTYAKEKMA